MPNQFLDIQGTAQRITHAPVRDAPAQGQRISTGDVLAKIIEGPFKVKYSASAGVMLAAKPGIRYFIHSASLSLTQAAASAGTVAYMAGTIGGISTPFIGLTCTANAISEKTISSAIDVLFDENTAISIAATTIDKTISIVTYQEVQRDDS